MMTGKNYRTVIRAVESIEGIRHSLEMTTINLELNVPIEASQMPEYLQAIDAIENYRLAIKERANAEHKQWKLK